MHTYITMSDRTFKQNYKTDDRTFKKVKIIKAQKDFENNNEALDYLVNKGFEVYKNEESKQKPIL